MESTPKTGFFITVGEFLDDELRTGSCRRIRFDDAEDLSLRLMESKGRPSWWSAHTWANDKRGKANWEAASCIPLDLDWQNDGGKHAAVPPDAVARLDEALMALPAGLPPCVVLAHHTPQGARLVLLLKEPVTDRDLFVRAAAGADALVTGWLEAAGLLGVPSMHRPGYEVDHKAATDLARVLFTPRAWKPGEPETRRGVVTEYCRGDFAARFDVRWLASLAPSSATVTIPGEPQPPLASWPAVEAALLRSPGARAGKGKVEVRCPFHGPDNNPSAVVFDSGVLSCQASGCEANKGKRLERWAHTPGGLALLGDLAVQLVPPVGTVRGETLRPYWRTVGEWSADDDWLEIAPPPMDWLLTVPPRPGVAERHVLPRGVVGMLAAGGGDGKSMALMQLAVAVATGRPWLVGGAEGRFPGFETHNRRRERVLLALGEEDAAKARRRLYLAANAAQLTDEERGWLRDRLVVMPLESVPVGLMADRNARAGEEARAGGVADELEQLLEEGGPWALVILDPLSRFAGMETETDNAAATRFVQVLERFTKVDGAPTVLVSHHTSKVARNDRANEATASRGASALTDGVRWVATLTREVLKNNGTEEAAPTAAAMLKMAVTKNNYASELWPFWLSRGDGGLLRSATDDEIDAFKGASSTPAKAGTKQARKNEEWRDL